MDQQAQVASEAKGDLASRLASIVELQAAAERQLKELESFSQAELFRLQAEKDSEIQRLVTQLRAASSDIELQNMQLSNIQSRMEEEASTRAAKERQVRNAPVPVLSSQWTHGDITRTLR